MRRWITLGMLAAALALTASVASASHSWNGYHWARTSNPFTLKLENDLTTSQWVSHLEVASTDWTTPSVLNTSIVNLRAPTGNCKPILGKVAVCNKSYGFNGWLGLAQVWIYSDGHIAQGVVKLNDTYFNTSAYNTPAWRQFVMCQEVGHTFGLDHQDVNFSNANLGTCMDYTNDPSTNQHPNQHDYDQLTLIYGHLDTTTTVTSAEGRTAPLPITGNHDDADFGTPTGEKDSHGRDILFEKHLGGGQKLYTWVNWAGHGNPDKP